MEGGVIEQAAPDIGRLKRMFEEAQSLTVTARAEAMTDLDYYDCKQWSQAEIAALRARGQPDIVINRVRPAVDGIIGVSERAKSEPRAFPRTPQDNDSADVASDVLRYISDHARFHRIKQDCLFDMLVPGTMAALVGVDADNQIEIVQVRWEEFFADPKSRRRDFKDARYLGIAKWMYADDVVGMYPDKKDCIEGCVEGAAGQPDASFQDRPNANANVVWADRRSRRIMVVELYYREGGVWQRCVYCGADALEAGPSPYLDAKGRPDCPIEAHSAFVDRENNRYGVVRDMRGPQDEINKRRSKLLHLISTSQIQAVDPSAIDVDADKARREAARPDGVIPWGWQKVSTSDMAMGQVQLLAEAKGEMERMGPNPAVLGRQGEDQSGRALLARQQAGLVELALLYGALEDWELRIYRQAWARAKQFWQAPMYVRVTDDVNAPRFVGLNGAPAPDQQDPQQAGTVAPTLAEMDVDIILDTTPDMGTLQQEQFTEIAKLVASNPAWAQEVSFDMIVQLSSIPRKRQILETLKANKEQAAPIQAQQQQIVQAGAVANIEKTKSETALNAAKTQTELTKPHMETARLYQEALLHPANQTPPPGDPSGQTGAPGSQPQQQMAGPPPFG